MWGAAAWLGQDLRSWSLALRGVAFGAALLLTYLCLWSLAVILSREARLMFSRAMATTLMLGVLLLIIEIPAATGLLDYSELFGRLSGDRTGPAATFTFDRDLSYARPAHVSWEGRPRSDMARRYNLPFRAADRHTFTTDSHGFRNRREIDRADIALIGDSYIEGSYVSDEDTVATALEELTGLTVVNLGRSGYGSLQELVVLRRYALPLGPRMVAWFFFEGNDLYDDQSFEDSMLYLRDHDTYDKSKRPPFREASFSVYSFLFARRLLYPIVPNVFPASGWFHDELGQRHGMYFHNYAALEWREYEEERFTKTRQALIEAERECLESGCRLSIFFVPMKFRVYGAYCAYPPHSPCAEWKPWDLADRFSDFCQQSGLDCLDMTAPMRRAAADGELLYAPEDSHWNRAGHRFVATLVRDTWLRHASASN
jgi:hypothetical protein